MEKIDTLEGNISHSFNRVKADIIRLQDEFMQLRETQIRLLRKIAKIEDKKTDDKKEIKESKSTESAKSKKVSSAKKISVKNYVASKTGKKFHLPNCPYAQNIKPKTRVKFKTKTRALNQGYKPCSCIK